MLVRSLDQEDPLEEDIETQYSCLENSTDRDAWQAIQSMGLQRVGHPHTLSTQTRTHAKM